MDALVDGILAEVSARGSDPSPLRILRLRVVVAVMLGKLKVLLNVGSECASVLHTRRLFLVSCSNELYQLHPS